MDDAALKDYLRESHRLVALKLTKQARKELGLAAGHPIFVEVPGNRHLHARFMLEPYGG